MAAPVEDSKPAAQGNDELPVPPATLPKVSKRLTFQEPDSKPSAKPSGDQVLPVNVAKSLTKQWHQFTQASGIEKVESFSSQDFHNPAQCEQFQASMRIFKALNLALHQLDPDPLKWGPDDNQVVAQDTLTALTIGNMFYVPDSTAVSKDSQYVVRRLIA